MSKTQEKQLGDILKDVIKDLKDKKDLITEEEVRGVWGKAVGKKAAKHTKPISLRKATLNVMVDGSSWLYELTMEKKVILKKLEGKLRGKKIKEIRFRIGAIK